MYPYLVELQSAIEPDPELSNIPSFPIFQRDLPSKEISDECFNESKFCVSMSEFPEWEVTYTKRVNGIGDSPLSFAYEEYSENIFEQPQLVAINRLLENLKNNTDTQLLVIAYYKVSRDLKNITNIKKLSAQSFDRFDSLKNPFDAISNFTDLANWFFTRELQELREGKKRKDIDFEFSDLKQIRKAITTVIAPNARIYFSQTESTQLMVEWQTEIGEKIELSLNQLSSGYRNMLALVMDFARRLAIANPQMENPLEAEAVLMIDELDLHLHPTWQQKIIPDLRKVFPNTQIIATTHSPEIVTTVERHQVKILEDYQIKECPTPTRGMQSSDIVRYVLGLEKLRPNTEESRTLTALFEAIDNGNLEEAKQLRDKLQDWEHFDPDLIRADMQIHRLQRKVNA
jgi:predicted ATP-binding protein involved in virulence